MPQKLRVDLVAPPFAGHLFPMLELANWLSSEFVDNDSPLSFDFSLLSTQSACEFVSNSRFEFVELLKGSDQHVRSIANYPAKVGSNPRQLMAQFRQNLILMKQMRNELLELWSSKDRKPDLVLADFTVPVAGLTARQLGIAWWTAIASPCAMEIPKSVPSYLGGWSRREGLFYRIRDAVGRQLVRGFKSGVGWLYRQELSELGIDAIYRPDSLESIYADQAVLAYGLREFEFADQWPDHVHFIGPCTRPPQNPISNPTPMVKVAANRIGVLVSLGTHLTWAKESALQIVTDLAKQMPEFEFHFSMGSITESTIQQPLDNLLVMSSIPYDDRLKQYQAAIVHGGTGLVYACIQAGIPMLVWPHDFDQFDHAARIAHHGLGLWSKPKVINMKLAIHELINNKMYGQRLQLFQSYIHQIDRRKIFEKLFQQFK